MFSGVLLLLIACTVKAQDTLAYKASLKKYIKVTGADKASAIFLENFIGLLKKQHPKVPQGFWDELKVESNKFINIDYPNMVLPIYLKHIPLDDLNSIIAFYETPAGKRFVEKIPVIMGESMPLTQEWAKQMGMQITNRLKERKYTE